MEGLQTALALFVSNPINMFAFFYQQLSMNSMVEDNAMEQLWYNSRMIQGNHSKSSSLN